MSIHAKTQKAKFMKDNVNLFFICMCVALYIGKTEIVINDLYLAVGSFLTMFSVSMAIKYKTKS